MEVVLRTCQDIRGGKPKVCLCRRRGDGSSECLYVLRAKKTIDDLIPSPCVCMRCLLCACYLRMIAFATRRVVLTHVL